MPTMKKALAKIFAAPWYFAGFAVYPPLAIIAYNINELHPAEGMRSLVLSLLAALILFGLLWLAFRSKQRAALAVSFLLLLFYSYGHVLDLASKKMDIPRLTEWMAGLWLVLAGAAIAWLVRRRTRVRKAAPVLNLVTLGLVITSTVQIIVQSSPRSASVADDRAPVQILTIPADQTPPDIYYIIVDSYGRSDLLKRSFRIDNTEFIQRLEAMGFYVADCSQSNYGFTNFSLASTLDMDYMDKISERYLGGKMDLIWLPELLQENEVRQNLEQLGYTIVSFENDYFNLLWDDADVIYRKNPDRLSKERLFPDINGFEAMLIHESAALLLTDSLSIYATRLIPIENLPDSEHREIILYMFEKLKEIPLAVESPKFIYAHFVAPHFPIVFDSEGEPVTLAEDADLETYIAGYRGEVIYLNKKILEIVHEIIVVSATPPVIIIQGDHGDDKSEAGNRMKILNAYYLPGIDKSKLYPIISPVNSFRLVFNEYFGGNYDLLPDKSFYSLQANPLDYTEIPNPCTIGE